MSLHIYNTLTRTKEEFVPITPGSVKMYVCGPTVYDLCHLGHGRAYVTFDIIYRYLVYKGYNVTYVRNITDIDDKIIARAKTRDVQGKELAEKVRNLANKYIDEFHTDMESLGLCLPTHEPRATDYIAQMVELIEKLITKGYGYVVEQDVYFDVSKFNGYGRLSGKHLDELLVGARVEPSLRKKNPLDFSLWKSAKPDEPWWESPWGRGRPGWHIECSSMSLGLLGNEFDIHGGGQDLIFPHHENEIAQSQGVTSKQPVHYWIHNGFVTIDKEKMSKSLGNFFTLKEIFQKSRKDIVRFFLLSQHYRSPIDFNDSLLDDSRHAMDRIENCLQRTEAYLENRLFSIDKAIFEKTMKMLEASMDDDFNTAQALALAFDIVRDINNLLRDGKGPEQIFTMSCVLKEILKILGIKCQPPKIWRIDANLEARMEEDELKNRLLEKELDEDAIIALIKMRNYSRRTKNWPGSDVIRKFLQSIGYIVRDTAEGTVVYEAQIGID